MNNFFIDSDIEKLHKCLLDILVEFDRICRDNGIKYSLGYGTMLGAIRHRGFIPWDDDADIFMDRKNFNKFLQIAEDSLSSKFFLQTKKSDTCYPYNVIRLRMNNTAMIYKEWKRSGIHQGIYIDICPLDNVPDNFIIRFFQKVAVIVLTPVRISKNKIIYMNGCKKKMNNCIYFIKNSLYGVMRVLSGKYCDYLENKIITFCNNMATKNVGVRCEGGVLLSSGYESKLIPSEWIKNYKDIEFEKNSFMVFSRCDDLLRLWYGNYWELPPEAQRKLSHLPEIFSTEKNYDEFLK